MRITEGQLRRLIRQEVSALRESPRDYNPLSSEESMGRGRRANFVIPKSAAPAATEIANKLGINNFSFSEAGGEFEINIIANQDAIDAFEDAIIEDSRFDVQSDY